jgi:hypothetical protein
VAPAFPQAACLNRPIEWWYPPSDLQSRKRGNEPAPKSDWYARGRAVCLMCPHLVECNLHGIGEQFGMWGGLTPAERIRARKASNAWDAGTEWSRPVIVALQLADPGWWSKWQRAARKPL